MDTVYRADGPAALLIAPLDAFTAVFHRASGITHLLTEPAPQILAILGEDAMTLDVLMARLRADFDLADGEREALAARLGELVDVGLVSVS